MFHSALIVPVPRVTALISPWASRYDVSFARGIPPHVTVLFPFLPPGEVTEDDLSVLEELFAGTAAFRCELTRVGMFADGEVLHLVPEPAAPFQEMTRQLRTRWPALRPYGGRHEDPTPHVTVGHHIPRHPAKQATRSLTLALPVRIPVQVVQLWREVDGHWEHARSFPLHRDG